MEIAGEAEQRATSEIAARYLRRIAAFHEPRLKGESEEVVAYNLTLGAVQSVFGALLERNGGFDVAHLKGAAMAVGGLIAAMPTDGDRAAAYSLFGKALHQAIDQALDAFAPRGGVN